jgi:hypothetical protein
MRNIFISDERLNFNDAKAFCGSKDLTLLSLDSSKYNPNFNKYQALQNFYNVMYRNLEENTFIGVVKTPSRTFQLLNGEPLKYILDWFPGEPNNPTGELCVTLKRETETNVFGFNDYFCDRQQKFLCEEPIDYEFVDDPGYSTLNSVIYRAKEIGCEVLTIGFLSPRSGPLNTTDIIEEIEIATETAI